MSTEVPIFTAIDDGITPELANAANAELERLRACSSISGPKQPLVLFEHVSDTRRASNQFLVVRTKVHTIFHG